MKHSSTLPAAALAALTMLVVVGCSSSSPSPSPPNGGNLIGCSMEAKICPDGSAVVRSGPGCEFAPCPGPPGSVAPQPPPGSEPAPPMQACTKEAKVCPDGSTVGRTGPNCAFAPCPGPGRDQGGHGAAPAPGGPSSPPASSCKNLCGDGQCAEIVCMAVGCPCAESKASCPQDCK